MLKSCNNKILDTNMIIDVMEVMALIVTHMVVAAAHMVVAVVMVSHLAILPTIIKVMVVVMEAMEEPDIRPLIMNHFQLVCKCEAYLST